MLHKKILRGDIFKQKNSKFALYYKKIRMYEKSTSIANFSVLRFVFYSL